MLLYSDNRRADGRDFDAHLAEPFGVCKGHVKCQSIKPYCGVQSSVSAREAVSVETSCRISGASTDQARSVAKAETRRPGRSMKDRHCPVTLADKFCCLGAVV